MPAQFGPRAVGSLSVVLLSATIGCADKVDCAVVSRKMHECAADVGATLHSDPKFGKIATIYTAEGELTAADLGAMDATNWSAKCTEAKGVVPNAKQLTACLDQQACDAFADCFAKSERAPSPAPSK